MPEYKLVDRPDDICSDLSGTDFIGVDTEFMREKTFFAELCLVQIATGEHIFCVDPLADAKLGEFWRTAMDRTWIAHSARQDIEVIYQTSKQMPKRIFDTQIAAGLLGFPPQLGYASLASELFGVEIAKSHTRADWSKRPLADSLLNYAAEDVEYLIPAYETLAEGLDRKNRLAWAAEDSAQLLRPALYDLDPQLAIGRLKGARNLHGKRRTAAVRLAAWRETEALRVNRPRQWIVKDAALIDIAKRRPASVDELQSIDSLPAGLVRRSGKRLLKVVAAADKDKGDYSPPPAPNEAQKSLLKKLQQQVAECAADLGLAAETIASKKDLSAVIIGGDRNSRVLNGWRRELIGEQLLHLL